MTVHLGCEGWPPLSQDEALGTIITRVHVLQSVVPFSDALDGRKTKSHCTSQDESSSVDSTNKDTAVAHPANGIRARQRQQQMFKTSQASAR